MTDKDTLVAAIVALATLGLTADVQAQTMERPLPAETAPRLPTTSPPATGAPAPRPIIVEPGKVFVGGGTYTFTLNSFRITDTRSLHNDTDFVGMSVVVGTNPAITVPTKAMGDVNNGTHQVNLTIPNVSVEPGQMVAFTYNITNTGYNANSVEQAIKSAVASEAQKALTAAGMAVGSLVGCSECGSIVGPAGGNKLLTDIEGIIFADCDGIVAAGAHTFPQASLATVTANGAVYSVTDDDKGTDSATGCGSNSRYYVTWSVTGTGTPPVATGGIGGGGGGEPNGPPLKQK
jgi:hypothetical protein